MVKKILITTSLIIFLVVAWLFLRTERVIPEESIAARVTESVTSTSTDYIYNYYRSNIVRDIKGFNNSNVRIVMNESENLILLANDTQVYLLHFPSYEGRFITTVADPSKLRSLSYYSQTHNIFIDDVHLYAIIGENLIPLPIISPKDFKYSLYVKGVDRVYYGNQVISEADPLTFQLASSKPPRSAEDDRIPRIFYAKDARYVYYKGKIIDGADTRSFNTFESRFYEEYAYDAKHIYLNGEAVLGADIPSFLILSDQPYEGCGLGKYSKDKYSVFYKTERVEGADPVTFEALWNDYGKDANHSYLKGKIIDNEPGKLKVECDFG